MSEIAIGGSHTCELCGEEDFPDCSCICKLIHGVKTAAPMCSKCGAYRTWTPLSGCGWCRSLSLMNIPTRGNPT